MQTNGQIQRGMRQRSCGQTIFLFGQTSPWVTKIHMVITSICHHLTPTDMSRTLHHELRWGWFLVPCAGFFEEKPNLASDRSHKSIFAFFCLFNICLHVFVCTRTNREKKTPAANVAKPFDCILHCFGSSLDQLNSKESPWLREICSLLSKGVRFMWKSALKDQKHSKPLKITTWSTKPSGFRVLGHKLPISDKKRPNARNQSKLLASKCTVAFVQLTNL